MTTRPPLPEKMSKTYHAQEIEQPLYGWWQDEGHFKPTIDPAQKPFVISMPPPNITGALHLGHAITVLDANRIWRVQADQETTRLGHWNLKLREAVEAAQELLEDRHVEKLIGEGEEYEPVVKMLRSSLRAKPPSQPSVGLWPAIIPPRHLCLWLREFAAHDLTVRAWANAIEQEYSETEAWKT